MIALTARLNERDETIIRMQEELKAYDSEYRRVEDALDAKTAELIALRRAAMQQSADSPHRRRGTRISWTRWGAGRGAGRVPPPARTRYRGGGGGGGGSRGSAARREVNRDMRDHADSDGSDGARAAEHRGRASRRRREADGAPVRAVPQGDGVAAGGEEQEDSDDGGRKRSARAATAGGRWRRLRGGSCTRRR